MPFMQRITRSGRRAARRASCPATRPRMAASGCRTNLGSSVQHHQDGRTRIISHQELTPSEIAHTAFACRRAKPTPRACCYSGRRSAWPDLYGWLVRQSRTPTKIEDAARVNRQAPIALRYRHVGCGKCPRSAAAALAKADAARKICRSRCCSTPEPPKPRPVEIRGQPARLLRNPNLPRPRKRRAETPPTLKIAELRPTVTSDVPRASFRSGSFVRDRSRCRQPQGEKRLFVRRGLEPVFETAPLLKSPTPTVRIGTHVFTAIGGRSNAAGRRRAGSVVTIPPERPGEACRAGAARQAR